MYSRKKIDYKYLLLFIVSIQAILIFYHIEKKESLSVDEIYSFSLSNSRYGRLFPSETIKDIALYDIWNKWIPGIVFKDYIAVSENNRFDYFNVYKNQLQDTHPPLYYYLIHTVCSFFPSKFSKWYGFGLNIVLFIITQLLLFHVSKTIFKSSKYALLVCLLYGFSKAAIDNFTYISFNSLLSLFNLLLLNFFIKSLDCKITLKRFFELYLIIIFGGFTHYIFLLYVFSIITVFFIINLFIKEYKYIFFILCSLFLSIITLYLLTPEIIYQLKIAFYSQEVKVGAKQLLSGIGFLSYFIRKMLCVPPPYLFYVTTVIIVGFYCWGCWFLIDRYFKNNKKYVLITVVPLIIVFSLLSLYMNYNYFKNSYMKFFFCFYQIMAIVILLLLLKIKKSFVFILIAVFIVICPIYNDYSTNKVNKNSLTEEVLKNNNVMYGFRNYEDIQAMAPYLSLCDKVFLFNVVNKPIDDINLYQTNFSGKNYLVLPSEIVINNDKYNKILSRYISRIEVSFYEYMVHN